MVSSPCESLVFELIRKNNSDGLTITELVTLSKFSRSTVRVALARFEGANKVFFRKIGMAKVYVLEEIDHLAYLELRSVEVK